jgi:hypothetical protein
MGSTEAGRLLAFLHWPHEDLAKAMVQAEDDIRILTEERREAVAERDQCYEESRRSAAQLGGIIRILRDDDLLDGSDLLDDAPALREAAARPRRFTRAVAVEPKEFHSYFKDTPLGEQCSCGAQWLRLAERCVTQPVRL